MPDHQISKNKFDHQRSLAWAMKISAHMPLSLVNFLVIAITNRTPIAVLMQKIEEAIYRGFKIVEKNLQGDSKFVTAKYEINSIYISTRLGKMVNKAFREMTAIIFQSSQLLLKKVRERLRHFKKDHKTRQLKKISKNASSIKEDGDTGEKNLGGFDNPEITKKLLKLLPEAYKLNKSTSFIFQNLIYVKQEQLLAHNRPNDFVCSLIRVLENLKWNAFEKERVTGFLAVISYALSSANMLDNTILTLILTKTGFSATEIPEIIALTPKIGQALDQDTYNEVLAAGIILCKTMGVVLNTSNQNFDEALFEILNEVRMQALVYAHGITIAYGFNNPTTDIITNEEIDDARYLAKLIIGGRLSSLEPISPKEKYQKSKLDYFISDLANMFIILLRSILSTAKLTQFLLDVRKLILKGVANLLKGIHLHGNYKVGFFLKKNLPGREQRVDSQAELNSSLTHQYVLKKLQSLKTEEKLAQSLLTIEPDKQLQFNITQKSSPQSEISIKEEYQSNSLHVLKFNP